MSTLNLKNLTGSTLAMPGIIRRERLLGLLRNNIDKNLILVYSPPGYGKTALIKNFVDDQDWRYAWLNASEGAAHIYSFFRNLILALKELNSSFGNNTLQIIESRREKNQLTKNIKLIAGELVKTFTTEFKAQFKEDIILVIDEMENIEDTKWALEIFNELIKNIPSNMHLVLVTRQLPDFDFIKLIQKDELLKIGMEDLIFRFDEIIDLTKNIYSLEYSEKEIKILETNLGGWITGIQLILQSFGKDLSNLKIDYQLIPENIFNILINQTFENLDDNFKEFMLKSSIMDHFDAKVCNSVFSIENSGEIINSLISKNLITKNEPVFTGNGSSTEYNYPVLMKKFLNSRLYEKRTEDSINAILTTTAKYYLDKNRNASAINYLMKAQDYSAAVPLIVENFMSLFNEGKFEILWNWMKILESETEIKNPHIAFYLGAIYKFYIGDLERALSYLEKAIEMLPKDKDPNAFVKFYILKVGVELNLGKIKQVIQELEGLLHIQTTDDNKAQILYYLAYAYYQNAEYDKTEKLLNNSLELSGNGVRIGKQSDIYNLFGHIELIKGNFIKSMANYERVLEGSPNVFNKFETLCNLVLMSSQNGKYPKAKEFLARIDEMIVNFPSPVFKIPHLLAKQAYMFESCSYDENIKVLNEINRIAVSMNHKIYIYLSSRLLSDTYYYMRNEAKAAEYYKIAEENLEPGNELEQVEMKTTKAILFKESMNGTYEKTLLEADEYYKSNDYLYSEAQTSYRLAEYYSAQGNFENAKKYLEKSLSIASANGYESYFVRSYKFSPDLLNFANELKLYPEFVRNIINLSENK